MQTFAKTGPTLLYKNTRKCLKFYTEVHARFRERLHRRCRRTDPASSGCRSARARRQARRRLSAPGRRGSCRFEGVRWVGRFGRQGFPQRPPPRPSAPAGPLERPARRPAERAHGASCGGGWPGCVRRSTAAGGYVYHREAPFPARPRFRQPPAAARVVGQLGRRSLRAVALPTRRRRAPDDPPLRTRDTHCGSRQPRLELETALSLGPGRGPDGPDALAISSAACANCRIDLSRPGIRPPAPPGATYARGFAWSFWAKRGANVAPPVGRSRTWEPAKWWWSAATTIARKRCAPPCTRPMSSSLVEKQPRSRTPSRPAVFVIGTTSRERPWSIPVDEIGDVFDQARSRRSPRGPRRRSPSFFGPEDRGAEQRRTRALPPPGLRADGERGTRRCQPGPGGYSVLSLRAGGRSRGEAVLASEPSGPAAGTIRVETAVARAQAEALADLRSVLAEIGFLRWGPGRARDG